MITATIESQIRVLLEKNAPNKVTEIPALMASHKGREMSLLGVLEARYRNSEKAQEDAKEAIRVSYCTPTLQVGFPPFPIRSLLCCRIPSSLIRSIL